jgi:hypothetical protein
MLIIKLFAEGGKFTNSTFYVVLLIYKNLSGIIVRIHSP